MSKLEYCCTCGSLTGRAGMADDSLYIEGVGPFCESCYEKRTSAPSAEHKPVSAELAAQIDDATKGERIVFDPGWNDPRPAP